MAGPGPVAAPRPGRRGAGDLEREAARFADTEPGPAHGSSGRSGPVSAGGPAASAPRPAGPRLPGAGGPLGLRVRAPVEAATGVDLSGVRVHRPGPRHPLPGRAFTVGADIVVPDGASPRTLRHEVAHVVQHAGGGGGLSDGSGGPRVQGQGGGLSRQELDAVQAWIDQAADDRAAADLGAWLGAPRPSGAGQPLTPWPPIQPGQATQPWPGSATGGTDPSWQSASTVCPNCHQRPGEILAARQASEERQRRKREEQERHGRWEASHVREHGTYLKGEQTTLAQDIEESRSQLSAQRVVLLEEAARRSVARRGAALVRPQWTLPTGGASLTGTLPPLFPETMAQAWATANQEAVVVRTLTARNLFVPEAAALARQHFLDLYLLMLPLAEHTDQVEAEREAQSQAFAAATRRKPNPCPSCHDQMPDQPRVYRAPPPSAPSLKAAHDAVLQARSTPQWLAVLGDFERATSTLDVLALMSVPAEGSAAQGFTSARDLLGRQEALARDHPDAVRVRAVFYPKDRWLQPAPPDGPKVEIAEGIPWYFYLTHTPTKGDYDYPPGFSWTLRDVTSPGRPQVSYEPNDVERFLRMGELRVDAPPPVLFDKLDDKLVFPEGMLYWRYPDGRQDSMRTTEPWSLSDWLTAIGIGLTALGVILASAGLATPAVLTGLGVASAAFGIASTVADLQHRSELGILTEADTHRAILFIAADIVSVLTLGLGRAAALAGEAAAAAGRTTQVVVRLRQAAAIATLADKALGATVLVTMGADYLQQYQAIMESNLPPGERDAALKELTVSALFTGALVLGPHLISAAMKHFGPARPGAGHGVGHGGEPHPVTPRPGSDAEFLARSAEREQLPAADAGRELQAAEVAGRRQELPHDPEYARQIEIEKHTWKEQRDGTGWCRFSSKVCYTKTQLRVGVGGRGERTSAGTAAEVAVLRAELGKPPRAARGATGAADWADYVFYAQRRLKAIEDALAAGEAPPAPPRTFSSFRTEYPPGHPVRNEIRGAKFESRTRAAILEEFVALYGPEEGPKRAELILSQPHLSEILDPSRAAGMLTRPDSLLPNATNGWTAVSNKSRESLAGKSPAAVRTQVIRDLEEAVDKYAGTRQVRRTGGEAEVNRIWLLYDADAVPEAVRPTVRKAVAEYQRLYDPKDLTFEVGIF
jgi:Domain of unknown function (DUF4157)